MLTDKNEKEMKKYMFHRIALLFALLVIGMPQMYAAEESEEKSFDARSCDGGRKENLSGIRNLWG